MSHTDTDEAVHLWISQVNCSARGGVRFVGSVLQQAGAGRCIGRVASPRRSCRSPPHTPPGDRDMEDGGYSPGYTSQSTNLISINK